MNAEDEISNRANEADNNNVASSFTLVDAERDRGSDAEDIISSRAQVRLRGRIQDTDEQLRNLFGVCDRTGKGFVIRKELAELCSTIGISREDSDVIFKDLDIDHDGKITFADFSTGFKEFLRPEAMESPNQASLRRRASMWRCQLTSGDKTPTDNDTTLPHENSQSNSEHCLQNHGNSNLPRRDNKLYHKITKLRPNYKIKNQGLTRHRLKVTVNNLQFTVKTATYVRNAQVMTKSRATTSRRTQMTQRQPKLTIKKCKRLPSTSTLTFGTINLTLTSHRKGTFQNASPLHSLTDKSISTEINQRQDNICYDDALTEHSDEFWENDNRATDSERRRRNSIYQAWTTFASSLVNCNLLSLSMESQTKINQLYKELQCQVVHPNVTSRVDCAVASLVKEMEKLQNENKTLEELYNREKSTHVKVLQSLEEEIEEQVAKVEEKAKEKAKLENEEEKRQLQEQMDQEVAEMQAHLKIFQKVDSWLRKEHGADEMNQIRTKLQESHSVNRELRLTIDDMTSNLAVLRSDLAHSRLQYEDKCHELHQEREQVLEYMHQYDHLRRQLDLIHEANRRLQDTNDSLRQAIEVEWNSPSVSRTSSQRSSYRKNVKGSHPLSPVSSSPIIANEAASNRSVFPSFLDDLDSGLSTLPDKPDDFACESNDTYLYSCGHASLDEELRNLPELSVDPETKESLSNSFDRETIRIIPRPNSDQNLTTRGTDTDENSPKSYEEDNEESLVTPDRTYKIVLAGDVAVGKSTFIARVCKGEFVPSMASTLGVDYKVKTIRIDDKNVVLQLWDTAGQERYRSITKCYFRRADGVLLLYDVTNERSFLNIRQWIQDISECCITKIPLIMCGNKIDNREKVMKMGRVVVSPVAGERVAQEHCAQYFETSTKTGENVMESLTELARQMAASEDLAIQTSALRLFAGRHKNSTGCCSSSKDHGN